MSNQPVQNTAITNPHTPGNDSGRLPASLLAAVMAGDTVMAMTRLNHLLAADIDADDAAVYDDNKEAADAAS